MKNWRWILCSSVLRDNVKNVSSYMSQALLGTTHINLFVGKKPLRYARCFLFVWLFCLFCLLGLSVLLMTFLLMPYRLVTVQLLLIFKKVICLHVNNEGPWQWISSPQLFFSSHIALMLRAPGRDTEVFCPQAAQGQQTCRYCVVGVQLEVQTALQLRYLKYIKEKVIPLACDTEALYKSPFKFSPVLPSQKLSIQLQFANFTPSKPCLREGCCLGHQKGMQPAPGMLPLWREGERERGILWNSAHLWEGGSGVGFCSSMLVSESSVKEFLSFPPPPALENQNCSYGHLSIRTAYNACCEFYFEARSRTSLKLVVITEFPEDAAGWGSFLSIINGILMQDEDLPSCRYRFSLSNQCCPKSCKIKEQELNQRENVR